MPVGLPPGPARRHQLQPPAGAPLPPAGHADIDAFRGGEGVRAMAFLARRNRPEIPSNPTLQAWSWAREERVSCVELTPKCVEISDGVHLRNARLVKLAPGPGLSTPPIDAVGTFLKNGVAEPNSRPSPPRRDQDHEEGGYRAEVHSRTAPVSRGDAPSNVGAGNPPRHVRENRRP
jgi:hypothetical protein